jgi:hypothetical protein
MLLILKSTPLVHAHQQQAHADLPTEVTQN